MATIEECIKGTCECARAALCAFKRCKNCDWPVGDDGKTLVDHSCNDEGRGGICPDCGGPLDDRWVYGAL